MPGPYDFTGQNIENTYQRVVQTPDGINYYDGTGSLLPLSSSFISGASAIGSTITFTRGDGSTFPVTVAAGTGTPGGPEQSLQFNSASVFSGSNNLKFDYTNNNIILTGSLLVTQSHISTVDYIDFTKLTVAQSPAHNEGRLHWYDDTKTLQIDTDKNDFMIEVGHQSVVRVYNNSGADINAGKVVRISGSTGNQPDIVTASWTDDSTSAATLGFAATLIAGSGGNRHGYVVTNGLLRNINTNSYPVGTQLYLSSSGDFTNIPPDAPLHEVRLGKVIVQNAATGVIYVDIMNGYELTELHDVKTTTYSDGDLLIQSGSLWINSKQLTGSYGLTGSLNATSFTGSLFGTSSWANSASVAISSSFATSASRAISSSFANTANTANTANSATSAGSSTTTFQVYIGDTDTTTNAFKPFLLPKDVDTPPYYSQLDETSFKLNPAKNLIRFNPNGNGQGASLEIGDENTLSEGSLVVWGPIWANELNILPTTIKFVDTVNTASFNKLTDLSFINNKLVLSTGSFSGSFTGSLFGTASWATNSSTASYTPNALITASVSSNILTFTKGNGTTFNLTIATGSGGGSTSPGGSDTQIQYNSGSTFAGSSAFIFSYVSQSVKIGSTNTLIGQRTLAVGLNNIGSGSNSVVFGSGNQSRGIGSLASGDTTITIGQFSHTEGYQTTTTGQWSHAEGSLAESKGDYSHAEGSQTISSGSYSHAEGTNTISIGNSSHAEGSTTITKANYSHAEGFNTITSGSSYVVSGSNITLYTYNQTSTGVGYIVPSPGSLPFTTAQTTYLLWGDLDSNQIWVSQITDIQQVDIGGGGARSIFYISKYDNQGPTSTVTTGSYIYNLDTNTAFIEPIGLFDYDNSLIEVYDVDLTGISWSGGVLLTLPNRGSYVFDISGVTYSSNTSSITITTPQTINNNSGAPSLTGLIFNTGHVFGTQISNDWSGYEEVPLPDENGVSVTRYYNSISKTLTISGSTNYTSSFDKNTLFYLNGTLSKVSSSIYSNNATHITMSVGPTYDLYSTQPTIILGDAGHAGGAYTITHGNYQTAVGTFNRNNNTRDLFVVGGGLSDSTRKDVLAVSTEGVVITGSLTVTGSNTFTNYGPTILSGSTSISGSLEVTSGITGSLLGTASYAVFNPYIVTIGTRIYTDDTFITAGSKGYKHVGYNANIIKARTIANTNGYIDVNIKRNGTTLGTISLSNQSSSLDTTLTGWTTQLNTDDLLEFYVSQSSTYITDISIFIDIQARQ